MSNEYKDWEHDKIEEEKEIVAKYPFLKMRADSNCSYKDTKWPMMALELPDGWYDLFFQLCDDIKDLVPEDFYFIQVKEKYNSLICYSANSTPEVNLILDKYAKMAYYVCTVCGAPADKLTTNYIASFCEGCWKDSVRHTQVEDIEFEPTFTVTHFNNGERTIEEISFKDEWNRYLERIK